MTEKVCLCVFVCVMKYAPGKFGPRSLCHHSSSSPPSFPFPFLGKVQSVAQEDQPHLGLCCDASQRATQVHFVANMHAHTHVRLPACTNKPCNLCSERPNRGGRLTALFWSVRSRLTGSSTDPRYAQ